MAPFTFSSAITARQAILTRNASTNDVLANPNVTPGVIGKSPLVLFSLDIGLFLTLILPKIYNAFLPLRSFTSLFQDITPLGLLFQIFLTIYSLILIIPLGLLGILVGGIAPILIAFALSFPFEWIQGDTIVHVPVNRSTLRGPSLNFIQRQQKSKQKRGREPLASINGANEYPNTINDQAWFFVNGISTSRSGILKDLQFLEKIFQRPITGIFNKSAGPILDVVECVIQRDFTYYTSDIRKGYVEIRAALEAENTKKVIILCHSQGGIIVSLIIDLLLATISRSLLDKLEVYTFANASNHFNNPLNALGKPTIQFVEHFANEKDPISQFGVLLFSQFKDEKDDQFTLIQNRKNVKGSCSTFHFTDNMFKIATNRKLENLLVPTISSKDEVIGSFKGVGLTEDFTSRQHSQNSAAGQVFSGKLFVRWHQSGHLLINHYLGPDNNILETPEVQQSSRLYQYLNGKSPAD